MTVASAPIKGALLVNLDDGSAPSPPSYEASELGDRAAVIMAEQLRPMTQMTIGGARNSKSVAVGLDGQRAWSHGLCACHERPGLSLAAFCCPCSVWATNHSKINHLAETGMPDPSPERVGLWCALYAVSPNFLGIGQVLMQTVSRFQTRERYGVRGNVIEDTLIGAFLPCCSLVQEYRELEAEEAALTETSAAPETYFRDEEESISSPPTQPLI
ncbi:BQ2448_4093 [Microbotryum intermedium]|uniref:BQ2448_4093 protein n=1 Tax=Microbotryum intermedium TaxID=269621 RepID=A0A238FNA4_9BASI|nr:BQ2448_4093 [Microbotryum intermedium]